MTNDDDSLKISAHGDLTNRARGGIVIYLLAWLVITLPNQVQQDFPGFFLLNSLILLLVMLSRLTHYLVFRKGVPVPVNRLNDWLVYTILAGALHWGLMSCWVLLNPAFAVLDIYVLVTAAVLGIAGTTALSISNRIRILFPAFMMAPSIIAMLLRAGTSDLIFASMAVLSLVYVVLTSRRASEDYWQAIRNRALAEQRAADMERLSVTDQLTQLKNRSYFVTRFREEWKRGDRQRSLLSLLMLDLDHFKLLNDRHGHVFGDICLQQVAETLLSGLQRESDIVARYGGEEFVVLLPDTGVEQAALVAERLRRAVETIDLTNVGERVNLTCSIGGATMLPDFHENREILLKQADQALYQAKDAGRNRYLAIDDSVLRVAG